MRRPFAISAAWLLLACAILTATACRSSPVAPAPGEMAAPRRSALGGGPPDGGSPGEATVGIYVTSNGWHSAIVVPRAALPAGFVPEAADFPAAAYLSFGWGDAEYFPAPKTTLGMALRAALQPTPAVVHLAGLPADPREVFPSDEAVELNATAGQLAALAAYLDGSFDRGGAARARAIAPGLHPFSRFYPATGTFTLFNTCNTWTARGLQAGGWPVRAFGVVTAEDLMVQVRALAKRQDPIAEAGH